jgi:thiamine-phosphate pyrophosphorylase
VGARIPVFAIGGIRRDNLPQVLAAGAGNVVIVSDLLRAPDIEAATREAKRMLELGS